MRTGDTAAELIVESQVTGDIEGLTITDRKTLHTLKDYDAMMTRTQYRERPINSLFKNRSRVKAVKMPSMPDGWERCTVCLGLPDGVVECRNCGGEGMTQIPLDGIDG